MGKEGGKGLGGSLERGEQEGIFLDAAGGGSSGGVVEEADLDIREQDGKGGVGGKGDRGVKFG